MKGYFMIENRFTVDVTFKTATLVYYWTFLLKVQPQGVA